MGLMEHVYVIGHPLAQALLTKLRDKGTSQAGFRHTLSQLGMLLGYEIVGRMAVEGIAVETPAGPAKGIIIPEHGDVLVVSVLRAAIPFAEGMLEVFPDARQGVVSAKRVQMDDAESTGYNFDVRVDYSVVPDIKPGTVLIIADPMLATGSTILKALGEALKKGKPKRVIIATVICHSMGIGRVLKALPEAEIFTVAIDPTLDRSGNILPGLGDAGERAFSSD